MVIDKSEGRRSHHHASARIIMRFPIFLLAPTIAVAVSTPPAAADCFGSGSFRTCSDDAGNNYTVQQFGNQTVVDGYNTRTGSRWSQDTMDLGGGMTTTTGRAADGSRWTQDTMDLGGGMTSVSGRDSNGNRYSVTCDQFGCN
ncbi:MAG: hypothetical protein Q4615_19350 [Paracoccus aminovorans]|nr:hypothetical protein [Paracoccus aminovorans]